jgi:eukaryotic-like serine/threonine-protein kinase
MDLTTAIPEHLGDYTLIEQIGAGPNGVVWRSRRGSEPTDEVALKILAPQYAGDAARIARFEREARLAQSLDHPHIVRVHQVVSPPDAPLPFFAMDYLRGGEIGRLRRCPAEEIPSLIEILAQVCDALEYVHGRGLVHCDVKASNILLDEARRPFLTDFGMTASAEDLAQEGPHGGTIQYMAPEQFESLMEGANAKSRVDGRSDNYAIGLLLYDLLTGEPAFKGANRFALMYQRMNHDPKPPSHLRPDLPAPLEAIVLRALASRPERRFPTAAALSTALRSIQTKSC